MRVDAYAGQTSGVPLDPRKDLAKANQKDPVESVSTDAQETSKVKSSSGEDTIEISAGAQELLASNNAARPDAVERARQVLQSGVYNDQAALESTADKIANVFSANA